MYNQEITKTQAREKTKKETGKKTKTQAKDKTKKETKEKKPTIIDKDDEMKYDILKIKVYNHKGEREKESDFELKFKSVPRRSKDETKRFITYKNSAYKECLNNYLFPMLNKDTFITSDDYEPFKKLPKFTTIAIKINNKMNEQTFILDEYEYKYNKRAKQISATYIGNKETKIIKSFPYPSFNGLDMSYAGCYQDCEGLENFDFNNLIIDNCIDMSNMFKNCFNLKQLFNFTFKNTKLEILTGMFAFCTSLVSVDCSKCDLKLDTNDLDNMFYGCVNLSFIDISGIKFLNNFYGSDGFGMFKYCYKLSELIASKETFKVIKEYLPMSDSWVLDKIVKKSGEKSIKINNTNDNKTVHYFNTFTNANIKQYIIKDDEDKKQYIIFDKTPMNKSISVNKLSELEISI